ncbi:MAG: 50S ribosomal protein L9 [Sphingomonadales bacterium]
MQIILLERIERLGKIGDEVTVKDGFARNFLLPQKKALRATEANRKYYESQKAEIEARNEKQVEAATKVAAKVQKVKIVVLRQAGESGQLYGSVTSRDIARALRDKGIKEVRRGNVVLDTPIKELGVSNVHIRLHGDVVVDIEVNVARTELEAEAQELEASKVFETKEFAEEAEKALSDEPEEEEAEAVAEKASDESVEEAPAEEKPADEISDEEE